jgi:hypothetical protein
MEGGGAMRKKTIKKLQLSRETLVDLKSSDSQKILGGIEYSPNTGGGGQCCPLSDEASVCGAC